jgi:hypothetical protein
VWVHTPFSTGDDRLERVALCAECFVEIRDFRGDFDFPHPRSDERENFSEDPIRDVNSPLDAGQFYPILHQHLLFNEIADRFPRDVRKKLLDGPVVRIRYMVRLEADSAATGEQPMPGGGLKQTDHRDNPSKPFYVLLALERITDVRNEKSL